MIEFSVRKQLLLTALGCCGWLLGCTEANEDRANGIDAALPESDTSIRGSDLSLDARVVLDTAIESDSGQRIDAATDLDGRVTEDVGQRMDAAVDLDVTVVGDVGEPLDVMLPDGALRADAQSDFDAASMPQPCREGRFDHDADASTACVTCAPACDVGTSQTAACTPTSNRECTPCADGHYDHDADASTACLPCAPACDVGTSQTAACTPTSNRECTPCADGHYDHDADWNTACVTCAPACSDGRTERQPCTATSDRLCATCPAGYESNAQGVCMLCSGDQFDHDGRDDTVCVECDTCGDGEYEWQTCTPLQNRKCASCGSNPTGELAQLIDRTNPMPTQCSDVDPDCLDTVDILVLYTQAYLQLLGGSVDSVIASANQAVNTSNDALKNALVPPNYRFRLVAVEEFPYEERDDLKGDLVWLRNNPHYQATRRAHGADVGIALLGTEGFGGLAYSNHSTGPAFIERGLLVVDGVYFVPSFLDCQRAMLTIGHELGHVLGAGHRASQYTGSQGIGYGYHNQEPLYRRNDAYGLEVSQHGQKFYSLMSYANYKNENNQNRGCTDCTQLNAFSSPDLWWFFDQMDPQHGFCLVLDDTDSAAISMQCNIAEPWLVENSAFIVNPASEMTIPSDELLARAVPVGVDQPVYIDPADGVTEVTAPFSARNRDRIIDYWTFRSNTQAPLAPVESCNDECNQLNRANCSLVNPECGSCLPGYRLKGGVCLDRIESNTDPLHDGRFERGPISVDPADGNFEISMPMETDSVLEAIELYLMTVDANGDIDYEWAGFSPNVWSLDAAPEHAFELVVYRADGSSILVGTENSANAIMQDVSAQKTHSLSYEFEVNPPITQVDRVVLRLQSNSGYAFNVSEVMVFGRVP